uniref:Uncharacterized protein n=1 Tax=Amphimedon queenslandica TaxID=400682 RepID=A0A1X7U3S7_AMPQE
DGLTFAVRVLLLYRVHCIRDTAGLREERRGTKGVASRKKDRLRARVLLLLFDDGRGLSQKAATHRRRDGTHLTAFIIFLFDKRPLHSP